MIDEIKTQDESQKEAAVSLAFFEDELKRRLEELKRMEEIQADITDLQAIIEKTKRLFHLPASSESLPVPLFTPKIVDRTLAPPKQTRRRKGSSLKENAKVILEEFGRPMKTPEIATQFHERRFPLSEKNSAQTLRRMFKDNPDLFKKVAEGEYELIK